MSDKKRERILEWLKDAHAMEVQVEQMLKNQAGRIESYPQLKARIEQHIEETRTQAGMLEGCIDRLGGSTSVVKDTSGKVSAMGQSFAGLVAGDEVMKDVLGNYTIEHMEIASYKILIAAAEEVGDAQTKDVCERILKEEEAMAQWLHDNMRDLTLQYMARENDPNVEGKR